MPAVRDGSSFKRSALMTQRRNTCGSRSRLPLQRRFDSKSNFRLSVNVVCASASLNPHAALHVEPSRLRHPPSAAKPRPPLRCFPRGFLRVRRSYGHSRRLASPFVLDSSPLALRRRRRVSLRSSDRWLLFEHVSRQLSRLSSRLLARGSWSSCVKARLCAFFRQSVLRPSCFSLIG